MKKRILLFGLLVLTVATLIFAFAFTTSAKSNTTPTVSVDKFNLVFSDNVYLKYAVKFSGVSESAISEETVGMLFFTKVCDEYVAGKEDASSSLIGYTTISGVKYYTFEYRGVTAKRMTEDVYCVAYIDYNGERYYSEPVKYSVLEYAYTILGKLDAAANTNTNYKALITATIEQGAAAQKYFGYKANRLANASYYQIKVVNGTLEDGFDKGLYLTTETATLTANKVEGCVAFVGWKNSAGAIVSTDNPMTVTGVKGNEAYTAVYGEAHEGLAPIVENNVPATCTTDGSYDSVVYCKDCGKELSRENVTVEALGHDYTNGVCIRCSEEEPPYVRDGNYIYFGEYPQTIKADNVTIDLNTQDSRGYYLGSDGYYYAAVTANPYSSSYTFTNNATVVSGTVYYFKVEPIRWRILSEENGEAFLLCDFIIANMMGSSTNNYKDSNIRAWLNAEFYNTAFTSLEREIILTTDIDNSLESTGYTSNPYVCEDTEDKIFLLSYAEATNSAYGFKSGQYNDTARRMQTSDYTRATGAWMYSIYSDYGMGIWWLRSPFDFSDCARVVSYDGFAINSSGVYNSYLGVVPALKIRL